LGPLQQTEELDSAVRLSTVGAVRPPKPEHTYQAQTSETTLTLASANSLGGGLADFEIAMQDVYDFFYDVNKLLLDRGLHRLDDMLTASMAKHARSLVENQHFNGHPDLIVQGRYANNSVKSGSDGVDIKSTVKKGGAIDRRAAPRPARDGTASCAACRLSRAVGSASPSPSIAGPRRAS
jgi:hypothetical protein